MFRFRLLLTAFLVIFLGLTPLLHAVDPAKSLPLTYRHWLTEEVPYIIESGERNEFLALHTDAERDAFIRNFWELRNPSPGSETNSYKEEHYRRLAYVNEQYGNAKEQDGWRTDQGMIYIKLGPPQSKASYPNSRNVRPILIWFYQSYTPALPTYFSVVFYKRSVAEPWALYSPYQDGPNRLVTGLEGLNDQNRSLKILRDSLGGEVARSVLSLIPSEPVDLQNYSPSLISDSILATIHGLADTPVELERININRRREKVTSSILSGNAPPESSYTVIRDDRGRADVDYFLRFPQPDSSLVGARKTAGTGYDMTLQHHITTESGRPVYDTVTVLAGALQAGQLPAARSKIFAAEDQLPLEPGKYIVRSTLTNNLNLEAHRTQTTVIVPPPSKTLAISIPVAYSGRPGHLDGERVPFSYSGVRFAPQGAGTVTLHAGDPLQCVFQLWLPKSADGKVNRASIAMHYYYGSPTAGGKPMEESDETVTPTDADAAGNLVTGHVFATEGTTPGSYRVIIRATQAGSPPAFGTMTMRITGPDVPVSAWTAFGPPEAQQEEMKRALSAEASGDNVDAVVLLRSDLDLHPQNIRSLARLATLLAEEHKLSETAQLAERPAFRDAVDIATLTLVSEALVSTGQPEQAMDLLNRQSRLQPLNATLYTQLAKLDDQAGKHSEGDAARKQALQQRP